MSAETAAGRIARERLLKSMFDAAVDSARPDNCVAAHLPLPPEGRTVVVGAGKAAAAMARVVEDTWRTPVSGVVVTRYGHAVACRSIEVLEAGHPMPDEAGVAASKRLLGAVSGLTDRDLVICLASGGGSALLPLPPPGVTLNEERELTRALLVGGATIEEMNCVRKHLSLVRGGRLARAAAPARVVTLAISDVPGDDPSTIASGPSVPDPSTRSDALAILRARGIDPGPAVRGWLEDPASETPKPDRLTDPSDCRLIATPQTMLEAAAAVARDHGYAALILGSAIEGEARDVGTVHAGIALQAHVRGQPVSPPCVILSGGETTVTVRGGGRGGRNLEFLLGMMLGLRGASGISVMAADTDGIDGTEDAAGAIVDENTPLRAARLGLSPREFLARNDAYGFFQAVGGLVKTGATRTNVNDFRAIVIDVPGRGGGDA